MPLKNACLKAALRGIRPFIPPYQESASRRFLIVSTTGLGDTLWASPAIESLRKSFPSAFLGVLTSSIGLEVLQHNPYVDRLYLLEEPLPPRFFSMRRQLYEERFDTILFFHASQRLVLPLCSLLGARTIIGTEGLQKGLDSLLTEALPCLAQHEIVRRLKMVERVGGSVHSETLSLFLRKEERLPPRSGLWIAIHPGSKDRFKRWPEEQFAAVGRELQRKLCCEILVTGTKNEESAMRNVAAAIPGAHMAPSNLSFRSFAALLEQMNLLICNDTGPFHAACALGTPAVGLFAPTDPLLCGPHRASRAVAIAKQASCFPCLKRKCPLPFCLLQIGPREVAAAAAAILYRAPLGFVNLGFGVAQIHKT